jgi:hypothetical protein
VQQPLELHDRLLRAAEQDAVERRALEAAEGHLGRALEVPAHLLVHAALVARLRPAALVVAAVHLVRDQRELRQLVGRPAQHARDLPVNDHDAPAPAHGQLGERLDERRVVDHGAGLDRPRQLDRLEQARRLAGEHREAVGAVGGEPVEVAARALDVRAQRLLLVVAELVRDLARLALGLVDQRPGLGRARRRGGELGRVEVEEQAEDAGAFGTEIGEAPQEVAVELVGLHQPPTTHSGTGEARGYRGRSQTGGAVGRRTPLRAGGRAGSSTLSSAPAARGQNCEPVLRRTSSTAVLGPSASR